MEITIERDGLKLYGLLEGTTTLENDRVVILMHGFKGDLGYDENKILPVVAHALNQAGLPTLRFDFAGCGKSDGKFEDMTVLSELLDGMKVIDFVRQTVKAKHIYLFGHSQGGVVASMLAAYYRDVIEKLVLLATAVTLKDDALVGECQGSRYDPNHIPEFVMVGGFKVGGDYFRTAQLLPIYETAQHFAGPALLIHGTADQIVSPEATRKYHVIMPQSVLHLIDGEGHMFNGPHRPEVVKLVTDFLAK
ncbi:MULTISPECIES: alpha/beta hydrolase [Limosilactobacillus]|uniref:alpha/beta hydrolase n=1 Tax=Limosilactobacillus TaxID=2742598 RepID=UPI002245713D|nr:alpha/beta fold hydrolase [Limosilactobacillus pontis]MCX2186356.1 alpha/beta hydrolase [Limosilactobacillus pontis]MCX2188042.1 alpha/beta hydrolase [Limosilactobacillus pontis]